MIAEMEVSHQNSEAGNPVVSQTSDLKSEISALSPDALVATHKGLVYHQAKKFARHGVLDVEDLAQEGMFGLLRAAQNYDPARAAFSTHAVWWIRRYMLYAISLQPLGIARVSLSSRRDAAQNWQAASAKAQQELGREPSDREIWQRIPDRRRAGVQAVREALAGRRQFLRADKHPAASVQAGEDVAAFDAAVEVGALLQHLPIRERLVVSQRFGLDGQPPMEFGEIGRAMNPPVSKQRIEQLLRRAMAQLRAQLGVPPSGGSGGAS